MTHRERSADKCPVQVQRIPEFRLESIIDRALGDAPNQFTHQPTIGNRMITGPARAVSPRRGGGECFRHRPPVQHLRGVPNEGANGVQAGVVREQLADGDRMLSGLRELGPVPRHWIAHIEEALIRETMDEGGENALGGGEGESEGVFLPRGAE